MGSELDALRERIDAIDARLSALFEERLTVCRQIGAVKRASGRQVRDPAREEIVIQARLNALSDARNGAAVAALYREIMRLCAQAQHTPCEGDATWRSTDTFS